jgi:hypothetical protein
LPCTSMNESPMRSQARRCRAAATMSGVMRAGCCRTMVFRRHQWSDQFVGGFEP